MQVIGHPSEFINPALVKMIRDTAGEAEQLKQLHPTQLSLIHEQKWFQLFVPKAFNGLELSLTEGLMIEEGLAWADGSTGWTVTLCSGACWFIGFLPLETAVAVFNTRTVCLAGSGKASGIAKRLPNGYEITGCWNYATGAAHATAFTVNCIVEQDGNLLHNQDGSPLVESFLFLRGEVTVHENWNAMGMIATGSHSFEVKKVFVDKNRTFSIDSSQVHLPQPIYQYPFLQFAQATLAVNSSGMALRFLELCKIRFSQQPGNGMQVYLQSAQKQLHQIRQLFYATLQDSWDQLLSKRSIEPALLEEVAGVSRKLALTARQMVNELYPGCGLKAADPATEINRLWRNLHTASLHSLLGSLDKP